ncbi:MAG: acylphosphatase [Spirochaetes bacterium]|nr:acylphosphatase [Spirochaetota bacterium]MBU0954465.1 acylphosphatase [Spirochaetota bacterium]
MAETKKDKPEPRTAFLALVRGRVQGVGFRYEARSAARALGLKGWVMNLDDGGVETWAEGPESSVQRYLGWLHNGPPGARVETVDVSRREPSGKYDSFKIEY